MFGDERQTVSTMPLRTSPRLKVCCVVLATFSLRVRSCHWTRPSSLTTVTCLLVGVAGPDALLLETCLLATAFSA